MKNFKQYYMERKYWGNEAAGTIFIANDTKRILFMKRSGEEDSEQGQWEITIGGKKEDSDIDIAVTRDREAGEELGVAIDVIETFSLEVYMDTGDDREPFKYFSYAKIVSSEFKPKLSDEHSDWKWVNIETEKIPLPLHFGAKHFIFDSNKLKDLLK